METVVIFVLFVYEEANMLFLFSQTEEDYIPYPSVHEVGQQCFILFMSWNFLHLYLFLLLFSFWG